MAPEKDYRHSYDILVNLGDIQREGQKEVIAFSLRYDEKLATMPMNLMYFVILNYLCIFRELFLAPKQDDLSLEIASNLNDTIDAVSAILESSPSSVSIKARDVFTVLKNIRQKEQVDSCTLT